MNEVVFENFCSYLIDKAKYEDVCVMNYYNLLRNMNEEIERLNNIINELEEWLEESIEKHTDDYLDWKYDKNVYLAGSEKLQNVFDKLQELKGSDK